MDVLRRYAVDLMKQVGMAAQTIAPSSEEDKKELAKLEIRAEVDPKVWTEISDFVERMLDAGLKAGTLDKTIREVKEYAQQQQREFEDNEALQEAVKLRQQDAKTLSPAIQELLQGP